MITPLRPLREGGDQENVEFCSLGKTVKFSGVLVTAEIKEQWFLQVCMVSAVFYTILFIVYICILFTV